MTNLLLRSAGRALAGMVAAMTLLVTGAHATDDDAQERARLAEQRRAIDTRFAERDKECRQRFIVSACVAEVRRERRVAMDALRVRQRAVDDARRQQRASDRRAALAAKAADDARRERERAAKAAASPAAASSAASAPRLGRPLEAHREPKAPKSAKPVAKAASSVHGSAARGASKTPAKADAETRRQLEERSRASFAARQKEAARHREDTANAAIDRMSKHSPAKSLPIPSAPVGGRAASAP